MSDPAHLTWHPQHVLREDRERLAGHRGCVVWFTGLSGSGKSTVANLVEHKLHARSVRTFLLDGDNVRHGLNASPELLRTRHDDAFAERFGLGFGPQDREENIRRIGCVAELFCAAGIVTLVAFVSPYRRDREAVRQRLGDDFIEVFVDAPLSVCETRDPKGLYKQARAGKIQNFTGIDDPYEPPLSPELRLDAQNGLPEQLADQVVAYLRQTGRVD